MVAGEVYVSFASSLTDILKTFHHDLESLYFAICFSENLGKFQILITIYVIILILSPILVYHETLFHKWWFLLLYENDVCYIFEVFMMLCVRIESVLMNGWKDS